MISYIFIFILSLLETFDEVVRENVDDFEMDPPEALADAINQFKMQGVDLTGLDTSGGVGREEALENIKLFVQVFFRYICTNFAEYNRVVMDGGPRLFLITIITIM